MGPNYFIQAPKNSWIENKPKRDFFEEKVRVLYTFEVKLWAHPSLHITHLPSRP